MFVGDHNIIKSLFLPRSYMCTHTHTRAHTLRLTHKDTYHSYEFGVLCGPSGLWMIPEVDISSHDTHQKINQLGICLDFPT